MASPQVENGHIDIANTIADKLCSYRMSGQEWQIVWVIIRKTWGWLENTNDKNGVKKKMDRIALSQFAELTGIDRRKCHDLLKKLINKEVIIKTVTHKGDGSVISYGIQKDFDLWKVSPKKGTVPHKGDKVSPIKGTKVSPKRSHTKEKKETIKDTHQLFKFVDQFSDYIILTRKAKAPEKSKVFIENSMDTVEKLIRIDGFDFEYIKSVIRWAVKDDFYATCFFSLAPLRKKSENGGSKFSNMAAKYDKLNGAWSPGIIKAVDPDEEQKRFEDVFK